ncbi:MerR family transcriptional regulator [Prolixibacteraceae bacterium Z1-6]|uniref:MerR family transcriptional regulator n=1 Tax=Draconibacterium aestuarii TaxID=2998507 RepID=A0A9X3F6G9_9BACT|nr:MerR family transcriptional regulator [Prolixibacteraceae bacterium Z1-6]
MPYKKPKIEKIYYSIGEVAKMMDVGTPTIRYWENEFENLKPYKNKKGNRLFTPKDIETIRFIHYLVKTRGLTIKGAKKKLKENRDETIENYEIVKRLEDIRQELIEIRDGLDENTPLTSTPKKEE